MNILVVCQHYWPENFRVTEICETLVQHGHQVTALVGLPNYPTGIIPKEYRYHRNRKQCRNGVEIRRCFEIGRRQTKIGLAANYLSYMISACIKGLFLKKNYDVIFAFSTSPVLMSYPGVLLRRLFRKKLMIYVLDIWPACLSAMNIAETSLLYRLMKHVSHHIYSSSDKLMYSSMPFRDYLQQIHNISVSAEDYLPQFADDIQLIDNYDLKQDDIYDDHWHIVFTGNIGKVQAIDNIIRAADLLRDLPIKWHIVGDGTALEDCKELAKKLQLNRQIVFYGRLALEEMPKFYQKADALIVSMKQDSLVNYTLPGKVQSYMASGKPLIGAIAGEAQRIIKAAKAGICCIPDNPEMLAQAVCSFINLPKEKRAEMGKNARRYYDLNFSKQVHMNHLESELKKLGGNTK